MLGNLIDYANVVIANQLNESDIETIVTNIVESAEMALIKKRELDKSMVY